MKLDTLYSELTLKTKTKIVLLVLDGLGDIATKEQAFLTPLEAAVTPNLDALAKVAAQGRMVPIAPGITPGSGPGHRRGGNSHRSRGWDRPGRRDNHQGECYRRPRRLPPE